MRSNEEQPERPLRRTQTERVKEVASAEVGRGLHGQAAREGRRYRYGWRVSLTGTLASDHITINPTPCYPLAAARMARISSESSFSSFLRWQVLRQMRAMSR